MANANGKKRVLKAGVSLAVVAAVATGGFFAWRSYQRKQNMAAMSEVVRQNAAATEKVARGKVEQIVTASGTVKLKDEQSVYSGGKAKVNEVFVEVGDRVSGGQKLVTYDATDTQATLERQISEAEISLRNQRITLSGLSLPVSQSEIDQLQSVVDSAQKSLDDSKTTLETTISKIETQKTEITGAEEKLSKAEREVEMDEELFAIGGISQSELDSKKDALKDAQKALDSAKTALDDLERQKNSTDQNISYAEKNLSNAKKRLDEGSKTMDTEKERLDYQKQQNQIKLSEIQLEDLKRQLGEIIYETTSPLSGAVTAVSVDKGSTVDETSVLIKVADFSQLIVESSVSEYDAPYIKIGQAVKMTTDGLPDAVYTGAVTKISDQAATQSAMSGNETVVSIETSLDNPDGAIKPGFNLDMEIIVTDAPDVMNVSTSALVKDPETGAHYVYKVDGERILRRADVTAGVYGDMTVEITTGLNEGDEIVTSPTDAMTDGVPLRAAAGMTGGAPGGGASERNMMFGGPMMSGGAGGSQRSQGVGGNGGTMTMIRP
ncbi:MAG: efflux RND transporter periplasmic adaptor subunit [Clostridiales bacterium]|nr:efflux RND transporter periplasmic adaptor subunit [Clostridiales bacterium]